MKKRNPSSYLFLIIFLLGSHDLFPQVGMGSGVGRNKKRVAFIDKPNGNGQNISILQFDWLNQKIKIEGLMQSRVPFNQLNAIFGRPIVARIDIQILDTQTGERTSFSGITHIIEDFTKTETCSSCDGNPKVFWADWAIIFDYANDPLLKDMNCEQIEGLAVHLFAGQYLLDSHNSLSPIPDNPSYFLCDSELSIWPINCFDHISYRIDVSALSICHQGD